MTHDLKTTPGLAETPAKPPPQATSNGVQVAIGIERIGPNTMRIVFSHDVGWLDLTAAQAMNLVRALIEHGRELTRA